MEKPKIPRAEELETALLNHFEMVHSCSERFLPEIEAEILNNEMTHLQQTRKLPFRKGVVAFRPSSASKCERELFYQFTHAEKEEQSMTPYQHRWVRNASAVHTAVERPFVCRKGFTNTFIPCSPRERRSSCMGAKYETCKAT